MLHEAWKSKVEVPYCFPRSSIKLQGHTGQNITDFDPNWAFPDYRPVAAFKSLRFALYGILLIGPLGTNFREMLIKIYTFSFKKMHLKILSEKWQPFCRGGDELKRQVKQPSHSVQAVCTEFAIKGQLHTWINGGTSLNIRPSWDSQ